MKKLKRWLQIKLLGFDPEEYENRLQELTEEMQARVADLIVAKRALEKGIKNLTDTVPTDEWMIAVQEAIKTLDERLDNHEEALDHLFTEKEEDVTFTNFGVVTDDGFTN